MRKESAMFRLDGRTALITGGSGGLGAAIADLFIQAGARVVVAGRRRNAMTVLARLTQRTDEK
jgi:NAD(P)-dependent dehydrogenase (short-subunit alcohol dehydrogenase family)